MTNHEAAAHKARMQEQQQEVRARIARAKIRRGVIIYLYGQGKGKSSSAFGTLARSLGHGKRVAVVQFIKGKWKTGEHKFFSKQEHVTYHVMGTGFTWDTQDKEKDTAAAQSVWAEAEIILRSPEYAMLLLDEITYMFMYNYLDVHQVVAALTARPARQNVILTGRDAIPELLAVADTISEVKEIKHAFNQGVSAQKGIEF